MSPRKEKKEKKKPMYQILLDEIGKTRDIILILSTRGYQFDRPSMAAEKTHLYQLLELLEKIRKTKKHTNEIRTFLDKLFHRMPPPVRDIIKNCRDRIRAL